MISQSHTFPKAALIPTRPEVYLLCIFLIAPALNFLSGINVDLYAPSLPAITQYFHSNAEVIKNTISISLAGFAAACLFVGILLDHFGRRKIIIAGLTTFMLTSLLTPFVTHVSALYCARFIQGASVAIASIGSRTLVLDHFEGKQYIAAMLYTSVAYSLGMMLGPFIGSNLQIFFGWQACFYAYAAISAALLIAFILWVNESRQITVQHTLKSTFKGYLSLLKHRTFLAGSSITGLVMFQQMIYPTLGPFILNHQLHLSPFVYGVYALVIGLVYLAGNLTNRVLINRFQTQSLQKIGLLFILAIGLLECLLAAWIPMNLTLIVLPIILMSFALGFVFGNTIATTLALFPELAGSATGLLTFIMLVVAMVGVGIISTLHIQSAWILGTIIVISAGLQLTLRYISQAKISK